MADYIGMDVASVRKLAKTLDAQATVLGKIVSTIDSKLRATTSWKGADKKDFDSKWDERKQFMNQCKARLMEAATRAKTDADEQEKASQAGTV